jgi:hypothetical protein
MGCPTAWFQIVGFMWHGGFATASKLQPIVATAQSTSIAPRASQSAICHPEVLLQVRATKTLSTPNCSKASPGSSCHSAVLWAMQDGIQGNPEWYPGLNASSSFEDFQLVLHFGGHHNCPAPCGCHTALPGESCHSAVKWAMEDGIHGNPEWYPGLTSSSSFEEFQIVLHLQGLHGCPAPCKDNNKQPARRTTRSSKSNPVWGWRSSGQRVGGSNWCNSEVPASDWTMKRWQSGDANLHVRVLTYNLFWWNLFGVRRGNRGSAGNLIQKNFQAEPFTVMAFQECDSVGRVLSDASLQGRYAGVQGNHALAIAYDRYNWKKLNQGAADVAEDGRQQYYGRRGIQWLRLRHKQSRKTLFIVNHHGPLPIPSGGLCGGEATAYNILKQIADHAEDGDMIVVTGDFNANRRSKTFQGLQEHLHWLYTGRSIGGIDHFFSNYDESHVRDKKNLGSGGSDHDALSVSFSI